MKVIDTCLAVAAIANIGLGMFWYEIGNTDGVYLAGVSFTLCVIGIYVRGVK